MIHGRELREALGHFRHHVIHEMLKHRVLVVFNDVGQSGIGLIDTHVERGASFIRNEADQKVFNRFKSPDFVAIGFDVKALYLNAAFNLLRQKGIEHIF